MLAGDIVHGVSVVVAPGTVASVVGPNGSGKSTLLKALSGVIRLSSGRVLVGDRDVTGLPPEEVARAGVGYVPQIDDVFAPLTVRENLEMGGYLLAAREANGRIERVVNTFPRLGQMLTRRAGRLSGGERKMLAMGRVLMLEPAVFLLDEPTANLAPKIATELLTGHVRALAEAGAGVLVVEQRARAVLAISDYTYVLGGGQVPDGGHARAPVREPGIHRVVLRYRPPGAQDALDGDVTRSAQPGQAGCGQQQPGRDRQQPRHGVRGQAWRRAAEAGVGSARGHDLAACRVGHRINPEPRGVVEHDNGVNRIGRQVDGHGCVLASRGEPHRLRARGYGRVRRGRAEGQVLGENVRSVADRYRGLLE
jgi:ABC-type branched-subunit amino acid transport system ATPase component